MKIYNNIMTFGNFRLNLDLSHDVTTVRAGMSANDINEMRQRNKAVHVKLAAMPPKFEVVR